MIKRILIIVCVFLSCNSEKTPDRLLEFINAEVKGNTGIINLSQVNNIKWNKLYVLAPYTQESSFNADLRKYKTEIKGTNIAMLDDACVLLLFNNDKLVSLSRVKRNIDFSEVSFMMDNKIGAYLKKDAVFHYKKADDGRLIVLKP